MPFEIVMKRSNKKVFYQSDCAFEQNLMPDLTEDSIRELRKACLNTCCRVPAPFSSLRLCPILLSLNSVLVTSQGFISFFLQEW